MSTLTLSQFKDLFTAIRPSLLTPGNPKTEKGKGKGYQTFILHLAPASCQAGTFAQWRLQDVAPLVSIPPVAVALWPSMAS